MASHIWFFGIFTPNVGEMEFHFNEYFSKGLKPPTRLFTMVIFLSIQIWNHKPTHTHTHTPVLILLMVQKSGDHQLREWYFIPVFTKGLGYIQMVVDPGFFSINSISYTLKNPKSRRFGVYDFPKNGVILGSSRWFSRVSISQQKAKIPRTLTVRPWKVTGPQ